MLCAHWDTNPAHMDMCVQIATNVGAECVHADASRPSTCTRLAPGKGTGPLEHTTR